MRQAQEGQDLRAVRGLAEDGPVGRYGFIDPPLALKRQGLINLTTAHAR